MQLAQQTKATEIEHRAATLPSDVQESESILMRQVARMRAMRSSGTLLCLAFGAMAIFGKLAAVVSTVASISLFFAGLRRVGPTTASILATVEPLVTVLLAFLVFAETLGMVQLLGAALVLAAVPVLHARRPRPRQAGMPATANG
jgi:drug/metabolite transporter (DMT)-like permease